MAVNSKSHVRESSAASTKTKRTRPSTPSLTRQQRNLLKSVDKDALQAGLEEMRKAGFAARRGHELEDYYHWTEAQHNLVQIKSGEIALHDLRREEALYLASDFENNTFTFFDDVDTKVVREAIEFFNMRARLYANEPDKPKFTLVLNSFGGSCSDGFALFDFLRVLSGRGHHIVTIARGAVLSMGGVLLQAGDTRIVNRNCIMMIHAPWEDIGVVTGDNVGYKARVLENTKKRCVKALAERSKLTETQIQSKMRNRDWELSAKEILDYGFADELEK